MTKVGILAPEAGELIGFAATECWIRIPRDVPPGEIRVHWNGRDITAGFGPFASRPLGRKRVGWALATELDLLGSGREGDNLLELIRKEGEIPRILEAVNFRFSPYPLRLDYTVRETVPAGGERALPARLSIFGRNGTPDPNFLGGAVRHHPINGDIPFVFSSAGRGTVLLPAGEYEVIASRGPEYSLDRLLLRGTGTVHHEFRLNRVVDTAGWLSVELHSHTIHSPDSHVPNAERVLGFAGEGVEFLVATDHNILTDLSGPVSDLGLAPWIRTAVGMEVSGTNPPLSGHWNAFPFTPPPGGTSSPAFLAERRGLEPFLPFDLYDWLRTPAVTPYGPKAGPSSAPDHSPGGLLIQLNHPRGMQWKTEEEWPFDFLNEIRFDPTGASAPEGEAGAVVATGERILLESSARTGTTNLDFDLIEVFNRGSARLYRKVRADWFWLLSRGLRKVATANSDTHEHTAGYPRNLVRVGPGRDSPDRIHPEDVFRALAEGRSLGTTGPMVHFGVVPAGRTEPAGPAGEIIPSPGGRVRCRLRVEAAPWIPVSEVSVYANGGTHRRFDLESLPGLPPPGDPFEAGPVVRLDTEWDAEFPRDTWILVEAGSPGIENATDPASRLFLRLTRMQEPVAFTNPVFLDVDGNGRFDAPIPLPAVDSKVPEINHFKNTPP